MKGLETGNEYSRWWIDKYNNRENEPKSRFQSIPYRLQFVWPGMEGHFNIALARI